MLIRELSEELLDQAAQLELDCFRKEAWSRQSLADALKDPNALYVAAVEETDKNAKLLGMCGIWMSFEDGDIMNVAVLPELRRQGVGVRMMQYLMEKALEKGVCNYTLEVRESNVPAIRLYESLGFVTEGIRKNFYSDPKESALIMWKRSETEQ